MQGGKWVQLPGCSVLHRCLPPPCTTACPLHPAHPAATPSLQPPRDTMSPEMKARLRQEYYGLGGSPNQVRAVHGCGRTRPFFCLTRALSHPPCHPHQKMGNNYFLYICLVISFLAVLSKLTGAI